MKKEPIVYGQEYILMEDFFDYKAGDYFVGDNGDWLKHVRTGQVLVAGEEVMKHFETTGKQFDYDMDASNNEALKQAMNFIEKFHIQKKTESVIPSKKQVYERIERELERKKRLIIMQAVGLLIRFVIEVAVIVAIVWLVYRQCSE